MIFKGGTLGSVELPAGEAPLLPPQPLLEEASFPEDAAPIVLSPEKIQIICTAQDSGSIVTSKERMFIAHGRSDG